MKRSSLGRRLLACALLSPVIFPTLLCCRKEAGPRPPSAQELARAVVERARKNFDYRDFKFRLKIKRSFPNGAEYAKTFQFFGLVGDARSKVFARSVGDPPGEGTRYLMLFEARKLVSAKVSSSSLGDVETREDEGDLNKITFGNLSYPEFRHMVSLRAEDFDEAAEEPDYFVLRSHADEPPHSEFEESRASRFVYYVDKQSYLPARIEFFNRREKFKEFTTEAQEASGGRWFVRRGAVKDFLDQSVTLLEFEDVRFDEGVDEGTFSEENLRARD